jgi:hypothetical protein
MQLNPKAVAKAKRLIDEGHYRINTPWRDIQPSEAAARRFLEKHGAAALSEWYLAIDPAAPEDSLAHYLLPFGDFRAIHRSGVVVAKQRAAQSGDYVIEQAADDLLHLFDRLTAC